MQTCKPYIHHVGFISLLWFTTQIQIVSRFKLHLFWIINPSCPDPGQQVRVGKNFLFSHFFAVPQKGFLKAVETFIGPFWDATRNCGNENESVTAENLPTKITIWLPNLIAFHDFSVDINYHANYFLVVWLFC